MSARKKPVMLEELIAEHMLTTGRWKLAPAPHLRWVDLYESQQCGQPARAFSLGDAVMRELHYEQSLDVQLKALSRA